MTEAEKQLLTAYLDGVASAAEKEQAEALLRASAEAQQFFSALVSDSLRLKYLHRARLPEDFAEDVLRVIRNDLARMARRELWRLRVRQWVPVGLAAAVLPLIAWGTFVLIQLLSSEPESPLAESHRSVHPPVVTQPVSPDAKAKATTAPETEVLDFHKLFHDMRQGWSRAGDYLQRLTAGSLQQLNELAKSAWSGIEPLLSGEGSPAVPELGEPLILTSPVRDTGRNPFRTIEVQLPPLLTWDRFDRSAAETVLQLGNFVVLDISCRDGQRTWDHLNQSLRSLKIPTLLDSRLKKAWMSRQTTVYFLYVENLSRAQAAEWLLALHRVDTQPAKQGGSSEPQIRSVIAQAMAPPGRQRLAELLGLPTGLLPATAPSLSPSATGSLEADTLHKLQQLANGQTIRPGTTQAIAFSSLRYPPSPEILQFRKQRGQVQPDAYHLVLILRPER